MLPAKLQNEVSALDSAPESLYDCNVHHTSRSDGLWDSFITSFIHLSTIKVLLTKQQTPISNFECSWKNTTFKKTLNINITDVNNDTVFCRDAYSWIELVSLMNFTQLLNWIELNNDTIVFSELLYRRIWWSFASSLIKI